jgi:hypothetical protein
MLALLVFGSCCKFTLFVHKMTILAMPTIPRQVETILTVPQRVKPLYYLNYSSVVVRKVQVNIGPIQAS